MRAGDLGFGQDGRRGDSSKFEIVPLGWTGSLVRSFVDPTFYLVSLVPPSYPQPPIGPAFPLDRDENDGQDKGLLAYYCITTPSASVDSKEQQAGTHDFAGEHDALAPTWR